MKTFAITFLAVAVCAANTSNGQIGSRPTSNATEKARFTISRERLLDVSRKQAMKKHGGYVRKPQSSKGTFVILNAQGKVPVGEFSAAVSSIDKWVRVQTKVCHATNIVDVQRVRTTLTAVGGTLGVAVVESDEIPTLLVAPETGWAMVNVKALANDNPKPATLGSRVRKEILRAFAFVAGGAYATHADFVMRNVRESSDLDGFEREQYGVELSKLLPESASFYGLVPWYQATYKTACHEGWAPSPTNSYQQAIWDEIHKSPTKPIVIRPETAKQ